MNKPMRRHRGGAAPHAGWFTPAPRRKTPVGAADGAPAEPMAALNFRVPAGFKRAFKIAAASEAITQSALLRRIFGEWQGRDGRG